MVASIAASTTKTSSQQHWFAVASVYLHDQLRHVFDVCESNMLAARERTALCCELRRARRSFIDSYLSQLWLRCQNPKEEWVVGGSNAATRARTLLYFADADGVVRALYQSQAIDIGRLVAAWIQQTGGTVTVFECPFTPHTLTRLFFLLLSDIRAPLRVRYRLAQVFIEGLPQFSAQLQSALFAALQLRGATDAKGEPVAMPEWWEPLEKTHQPSATALALIAPPRTVERVQSLAESVAAAALAEDYVRVQFLLDSQRVTTLFSWLAEHVRETESSTPLPARKMLCLLAGPLLQAACDESFVDHAHPARKALSEWMHWAPGWQDSFGLEGIVPERCCELAAELAKQLVHGSSSPMPEWQALLDYLQQLRHRLQKDVSTAVASTRLSLQVLTVRTEVEQLLASRTEQNLWPPVVVEIVYNYWLTLLMNIHWREGTASTAWLNALAVVDALLASVQPEQDRQARQQIMQSIPSLLQELRKGFDSLGCARQTYSALLERLQAVHLSLMKSGHTVDLAEQPVVWPAVGEMPQQGEPFEVGAWLRSEDGRVLAVEFSDGWCTALLDTHNAALECCSTAALQTAFYDGHLEVMPALAPLLPTSTPRQ